MWEDPIVSDVRRIREQLSQRFDFDVEAIFADIRKRQAALGPRLVRPPKDRRSEPALATDRKTAGQRPEGDEGLAK